MEKSINEQQNSLFSKLRKLNTLIDQLKDVGVQNYIQLPRIAVLGTQSSGKSSVLEAIVGLDFLPRGDGVVTRRPLELRLCNINDGRDVKPWAVFEERKDKKIFDFIKVRETIEELTHEACKTDRNIVDKPIILNVYSPTCPNLTLIDLPGITRVAVGDQPSNIEFVTKEIAKNYCMDKMTIILCVIGANSDIATSDGLQMAINLDKEGKRTIGVLTKLDIMDKGCDAKKILMNEEVPLKEGYVAVKNKSKQDLIDKVSMKLSLSAEKEFFQKHPIYKRLPPGLCGTDALIQKLNKIFFRMTREHLPTIIKAINEKIKIFEEDLFSLGQPLPLDDLGKLNLLWNMISEYCEIFKSIMKGKYNPKIQNFIKDEVGIKIKTNFKNLLFEFTGDYRATQDYTDSYIENALLIHEGDSIAGFPSIDAFYSLLKPELEKLREPISECLELVFQYLEDLSSNILYKSFQRFPRIINEINEIITNFLSEEKKKAKFIVESFVEMEINYLFTNDYNYLNDFTTFIPRNQDMSKIDTKKIFIREIRMRIEAYFKLVVRNLRESIPKSIGYNLIRSIQDNMQMELYNKLYRSNEMIEVMSEPIEITKKRIELNKSIAVMKEAQKIIRRDPE